MSATASIAPPVQLRTSEHAQALILHARAGPYTLEKHWPKPRISSQEILIKSKAIGLNPIDWKCVDFGFGVHSLPWISGREAAGIVEQTGQDVRGFRMGERVFVASTNYRDNRTSSFQEYVVAQPHNVGRLPDWLSFEEGATLGVAGVAAAATLFDALAIPPTITPPGDQWSPWVLIWGGSCSTGQMMIQIAKQSGHRVFAVADKRNAAYLESLGADRVSDRHHPEAVVTEAQNLPIFLGVDCVSKETATYAARALQPGARLAFLVKGPGEDVAEHRRVETTDIVMKRFHEDPLYGRSVTDYLSQKLFSCKVRPIRYRTIPGGLEAIEQGLDILRKQEVSGEKLIVSLEA